MGKESSGPFIYTQQPALCSSQQCGLGESLINNFGPVTKQFGVGSSSGVQEKRLWRVASAEPQRVPPTLSFSGVLWSWEAGSDKRRNRGCNAAVLRLEFCLRARWQSLPAVLPTPQKAVASALARGPRFS